MSDPYSQADVARYAELAYAAFNYGPDNRAGPSDTRNFSDEVLERYDISASVGWARGIPDCDPSATSDLEALRSVFDTNGDGVLNASDTTWAQFRVAQTEPDGTLSYHTLADLGITEIDLMGDATHIELPDGSVITGQTTFTMNGQTRTVGEMTLATDGRGYRLEETESTSGGTTTRDIEAYGTGGELAWAIHVVAATDGSSAVNSYDDDGDGVVDRVQERPLCGTPLELQYAMTKGGAGYARVC